jgi:hypothetical protein
MNMKPVVEKLGILNASKIFIWNSPENYHNLVGAEMDDFRIQDNPEPGEMDLIHLFCRSLHELESAVLEYKKYIRKNGVMWISWPKKSSGMNTDLNDGNLRSFPLSLGLVDIKVCSINETWSALKFVIRKNKRK